MDSEERRGIWVPLGAGLVLVAVRQVLSRPLGVAVTVAVLLGLGAVLPRRPWRTAVIAALPGLAAGLVVGVRHSVGSVALALVLFPVGVAVTALLVKGGSLLVLRPEPGSASVAAGRRPKRFETKAQRGRFLVIVAAVAVGGSVFLRSWGSAEADRMADRRVAAIRAALDGVDVNTLRLDPLGFNDGADIPGGPYDLAFLGPDGFEASEQLHSRLQYRCIHVLLTDGGLLSIDVDPGRC